MPLTVAIDGPAGAGKSTVARRVARELGFTYLDTGAMYRAVAWKALQSGLGAREAQPLRELAEALHIEFAPLDAVNRQQVWVDGIDVTDAIRTPAVSQFTSSISAVPAVRQVVVEQQRQLGRTATRGVVLEGRDIGTVVFPDAEVKVFLSASAEIRARRRYDELAERGITMDFSQVLAEQRERDARDTTRTNSPLMPASDAILVNTDDWTIEQVVRQILRLCYEKMHDGLDKSIDVTGL